MQSLLNLAVEKNASDLHMQVGLPPCLRVYGELVFLTEKGILSEKDCSCGRKLLLIKRVYGRDTDFLKLKSGKIIPFLYFNYIVEQYGEYISGFQIIQESWKNIKIKIKPTKKFKKDIELELAKKISAYLDEVTVIFEQVKLFELSASGKRITVISKIKQ